MKNRAALSNEGSALGVFFGLWVSGQMKIRLPGFVSCLLPPASSVSLPDPSSSKLMILIAWDSSATLLAFRVTN